MDYAMTTLFANRVPVRFRSIFTGMFTGLLMSKPVGFIRVER